MISQKSLLLPGKWLHPDQTQSFPNLPYPLSVRFSSAFQSPNGCQFALSSAIAHMVKQFVKLFAIHYGLTFCLYMRSLYEAPLHSPSSISIRQLDLMSKSWNELLRHWRSSCTLRQILTSKFEIKWSFKIPLPQLKCVATLKLWT